MRLNEKAIKALEPPATGNRITWDDEITGLGIRITANGARSFILNYRTNGRERRMTIGAWPDWNATGAREYAKKLKRRIDRGEDPLGEKQQLRGDPTFKDLADAYLETEASKQKGYREYKRLLEKEAIPEWGKNRAADVRRRDVIELIEAKAKTAPIVANRLFELIRRVYNFGIRRDLVETSPCLLVRKPGTERAKDRVLSADEIRTLWEALDGPGFSRQTAAAIRLVLVTAARPSEVTGLSRGEVDGEWWTLPAARSKNGLAHRVPLTKMALEIIKGLSQTGHLAAERSKPVNDLPDTAVQNGTAYLFPSPKPDRPIHRRAMSHAIRRARAEREDGPPHLTVEDFSPHDLRRTAASHMAASGVERFIVGLVLNHVQPGVTKVYDRFSYDPQKKKALATWERRLKAIISGKPAGKVVAIR